MKWSVLLLSILLVPLSGIPAVAGAAPRIILDTRGADIWSQCMDSASPHAEVCAARSAISPGGVLAELARPTFGALPADVPPPPAAASVRALASAMQGWDMAALARDAGGYFPPQEKHTARIYLVANGAAVHSDMYVRHFSWHQGKPELDENAGEPVMLIDARQVAGYGNEKTSAADVAKNVVRHEMFHIFYAWYRAADPRWQMHGRLNAQEELLLDIQDEGIAHLLANPQWRDGGFPADRGGRAMDALALTITAFAGNRVTDEMLQKANQGPFWEKYGAISGALFAAGIEKVYGDEGLRRSLRNGPAAFILAYDAATHQDASLPPLRGEIRIWALAHQDMLSAGGAK